MTLPNIALIGQARSGKDTFAARLVTAHNFVPHAFASPLKTCLERLNPIIGGGNLREVRLNDALTEFGWEGVKDAYPEARRLLQEYGQGIRDLAPDFWAQALVDRAFACITHGGRVVVTDVRYLNEARALERLGFLTVRIVRPSLRPAGEWTKHTSETELAHYRTDHIIANTGTVQDLWEHADDLVECFS